MRLYEQGLIYRGKRLVNWDPVLGTAVSDLEVVSEEEDGSHVAYPLPAGRRQRARIDGGHHAPGNHAGRRRAWRSHPDDERYAHLIGKMREAAAVRPRNSDHRRRLRRPGIRHRLVKITPAHDFNDYAVGQRHDLPHDQHPDAGREDQRQRAAKPTGAWTASRRASRSSPTSKRRACWIEVKPHKLMVPRGDRTGVVIEPMLTDQWFVAMSKPAPEGTFYPGKSIAEVALEIVADGEIKFVPENWTTTYNQWLNNIQDWCISRQLWWGHQIPAWYDEDGKIYVARNEDEAPSRRPPAAPARCTRDDDVLDTWFSSALVPFSSLGWPEQTPELRAVPAVVGAGHRLRHHLLLGRAHGHDDHALHRQGAVQARVRARPGARLRRARRCPSPRAIRSTRST